MLQGDLRIIQGNEQKTQKMCDTTFKSLLSFVFIQGKSMSGVLLLRSSAVTLGFGERFGEMIYRIFLVFPL